MPHKLFTAKEYVAMMVFAALLTGILWILKIVVCWIFEYLF